MEKSIYRYILRHTKREQVILLLVTILSLPFVYLSLDVPKIIVNQAIGGNDLPQSILGVPINQIGFLFLMCAAFIVLVFINGAFKYFLNVYRGVLGERLLSKFRGELYDRVLAFPLPHFKRTSPSELIPMITAETEPLGGFIGEAFALPAFQAGLLMTYLLFIFVQNWMLGTAAIILYPFQMWLIPRLQRKVNALAVQRVKQVRRLADGLGESVSGIVEIRASGTTGSESSNIAGVLALIFGIRSEIYKRKFFIKFLNNFIAQLTPFFFYSIGGYFVIQGKISLGALVAVIAAYKDLAPPWKELLKYYQTKEDIRVKYEQIVDQFDPPGMLDNDQVDDSLTAKNFSDPMSLNKVVYREDEFIRGLEGVNFEMNLNEHVGIVGSAASGKEFVASIVAGIATPSTGTVSVGGYPLSQFPSTQLISKIGYLSVSPHIFTGTIGSNLLYGIDEKSTLREVDRDSLLPRMKEIISILELTELGEEVFQFGLSEQIEPAIEPEFTEGVIRARQRLNQSQNFSAVTEYIEFFDEEKYSANSSLAENILFGTPLSADFEIENLASNNTFRQVLDRTGLTPQLLAVGEKLTGTVVELFSGSDVDNELLERFTFIQADELPEWMALFSRIKGSKLESCAEDDQKMLLSFALRLNVARHRLGLIDQNIQVLAVEARKMLATELARATDLKVQRYANEHYIPTLTVQGNVIFGRVSLGRAGARDRVSELVRQVLEEEGVSDLVTRIGLSRSTGTQGARLTVSQRYRLAIARVLLRSPQLLIVDRTINVLDPNQQRRVLKGVLDYQAGKGVVWVMDHNEFVEHFDRILLLDNGQVKADGTVKQLKDSALL